MGHKIQPIVAGFRREFAAPLETGTYVNRHIELVGLNPETNFLHMRVWVREYETEYYLAKGNGRNLDDWKAVTAKSTIPQWDPNKTYRIDDVVMVKGSGKLYIAIDDNVSGMNPVRYPRVWQPITGDIEEFRREFTNMSVVIISVPSANPIFRVYEIEKVLNEFGQEETHQYEIDCKITETNEPVNVTDEMDPDLVGDVQPDDGEVFSGSTYKFEFFKGDQPTTISGVIICK